MTISSTKLTTALPESVYTSSGSTCCTVIYICNITTSPINVDIYITTAANPPTGSTPTDEQIIYKTYAIAATDTYIINTERIMFESGDELWVATSVANSATVTISYLEV
jgi:hypothetical protein